MRCCGKYAVGLTISRFIDFVHNAKIIDRAILESSSSAHHCKGDTKAESEVVDEQVSTDSAAGSVRSGSARLGSTGEATDRE
jgi:hypothetical protein